MTGAVTQNDSHRSDTEDPVNSNTGQTSVLRVTEHP